MREWTPDNYEQACAALNERRKICDEKQEKIVELQAQNNRFHGLCYGVAADLDFIETDSNKVADRLDTLAKRIREGLKGVGRGS